MVNNECWVLRIMLRRRTPRWNKRFKKVYVIGKGERRREKEGEGERERQEEEEGDEGKREREGESGQIEVVWVTRL